jgi:hypothetical protein
VVEGRKAGKRIVHDENTGDDVLRRQAEGGGGSKGTRWYRNLDPHAVLLGLARGRALWLREVCA